MAGEVRVDFRDRLAGAGRSGDRADLEVGVPGEQPQQLAARVAAGARHGDPYAHDPASSLPEEVCILLHEYATRRIGRVRGPDEPAHDSWNPLTLVGTKIMNARLM